MTPALQAALQAALEVAAFFICLGLIAAATVALHDLTERLTAWYRRGLERRRERLARDGAR